LWIVTRYFREWSIIKPRTSRGGNAERYIVCKGFLGMDNEIESFFRKSIELATQENVIQSMLQVKPDKDWLQIMLEMQEAIAKQETDIIDKTLELIKRPVEANVRTYIEQNVERSIQWCLEHNDPINPKWYDKEWYNKTINEEIRELLNGHEQKPGNTTIPWRGLPAFEVSQNDSPEHRQQQQKRHAVLFSRSRPVRADQLASRGRRGDNPDEEGWQKV